MAELLADGKTPLPRLADEEGQAFIHRLTSTENLSLYHNRSLPVDQRMDDYSAMMGGLSTIVQQYVAAANRGVDVHRELAGQMAFMLRSTAAGVDLIDEFLPTVPHDDKYPVRMQGFDRMKSGLSTIFDGAETSLSEKGFYSPEDFSLLLTAMAETLPTIDKVFAPDYRIELRKKLEALRAAFPGEKDTHNLQAMIDELGR